MCLINIKNNLTFAKKYKQFMRLRAIEIDDCNIIFGWENDKDLWNVTETQRPFSYHAIKNYVETAQNEDIYTAKQIRLMIDLENDKEPVGCVDLYDFEPRNSRAGIGILIDKKFKGKGYATQALTMLTQYAFNVLNIHNLYAFVPCDNESSLHLFVKIGFEQTAVLKQWLYRHNR
jgi:diamine N-acetyltransferase